MTNWQVIFDKKAANEFERLSSKDQIRIKKFIDDRLSVSEDPRKIGKSLSGNLSKLWRYRIGSLRIIAQIKDAKVIILIVKLGHRGKVYK